VSAVGAFTVVAAGTGINTIHAVTKGKDPFPTLAAGVVLGTICVGLNAATGSNIGSAFGALFLLGSFLTNGVETINVIDAFINSK
jgi:hypothetical protein